MEAGEYSNTFAYISERGSITTDVRAYLKLKGNLRIVPKPERFVMRSFYHL